jgi:hypothetical protein
MFIIDDIISWLVGKVMDFFFPKKDENKKLIDILLEREGAINRLRKEKDILKSRFEEESTKQINTKKRIIDSLKRRGLSTEKLIEKYNKPLNAILISYASQKVKTNKGYLKEDSFIREELKKYGSKYLGGTDAIIPPTRIPKKIKNNEDLRKWFEKKILKERYCKLKFLSLIDLKKKTFWKTYLPYEQKKPKHFSIGDVLKLEDLFNEEDIKNISVSEIIKDGDILWLASSLLGEKELDKLVRNQKRIESQLGNPSLRELTSDLMIPRLNKILSKILTKPNEISVAIVEEARFWNNKLK